MTEGEGRLDAFLVGPAIAHIDTFLVFLIDDLMVGTPGSGIGSQGMCTTVLETGIPGEGQLTRWIHVAC